MLLQKNSTRQSNSHFDVSNHILRKISQDEYSEILMGIQPLKEE